MSEAAKGRAANLAGSWVQRPSGLWQYSIRRDGRRQSFYGRTQAEALRKADQAKDRQAHAVRTRETVGGWIEVWLSEDRGLKPATVRKYTSDTRANVIPHLGDLRLDRLTTADIQKLQSKLRDAGKGPATITHATRALGTALEAAIEAGLIAANPTRSRTLRQRQPDKVEHVLTRDEAARLLEAAKGTRYEALFVLALTMGLREGELLALRWRDVDAAGTLAVRGSVTLSKDRRLVILAPKTRRSRRTLYLPRIAREAVASATHHDADLMFPAPRGGLMRGTVLARDHFRKLLDAASLPRMKFHDLRDTAATHMLEDGTPINVVSEVLGHADEAITLRRYAHVTRGMQRAAVAAMDARYAIGVEHPPARTEAAD